MSKKAEFHSLRHSPHAVCRVLTVEIWKRVAGNWQKPKDLPGPLCHRARIPGSVNNQRTHPPLPKWSSLNSGLHLGVLQHIANILTFCEPFVIVGWSFLSHAPFLALYIGTPAITELSASPGKGGNRRTLLRLKVRHFVEASDLEIL